MKCSSPRRSRRQVRSKSGRRDIERLELRHLLASDWQNPWIPLDIDDDGVVAPVDALIAINLLNSQTFPTLPSPPATPPPYYDTDGDNAMSSLDALLVVNALNFDQTAPTLTFGLSNDTAPRGLKNTDLVTFDATIGGTVFDLTGIQSLQAKVDGGAFVNVPLQRGGVFTFNPGFAVDGSQDGNHSVSFVASDGRGNTTALTSLSFRLDTTAPATVGFDLAAGSDSAPVGDGQTDRNPVDFAGQTEALAAVTLFDGQGSSLRDGNATGGGDFTFTNVGLADGDNAFTVTAWDAAGNSRQTSRTIVYANGEPVTFTDPDLEAAVRSELGLAAGSPVTTVNITKLTTLTADSNVVDNLTGLEHAVNLQSLTLTPVDFGVAGTLAGLAPLNGLSQLTSLALVGLQLDDAKLDAFNPTGPLASLDVRYNDVQSLDFLQGWNSLARLSVFANPVSDLSALTGRVIATDLAATGLEAADSVAEIAAALHNLPLEIYEYVVNRYEYQPYGGSMKGSQAVIETGAANDWDQSRLLVDLLAAAGVTARYRQGQVEAETPVVMNWLSVTDPDAAGLVLANAGLNPIQILGPGNTSVAYRFDHTWVEASLYVPGVGQTWVPFDPSWKFKDHQPGIPDLITTVPFDADGYLSQVRKELASEFYADQVSDYLQAQGAGQALTDVPYDGPIMPIVVDQAPTGLPYDVLGTAATYSAIPLSMTHRVQIQVYVGASLRIDQTLVLPEMGLQRVTISFAPAASNQVIPELRLDGQVAAQGAASSKFNGVTIAINHFDSGDNALDASFSYSRATSDYIAVGLDANQISDRLITRQLKTATEASFAHLNGQSPSREDEIGALLGAAILRYFQRTNEGEQLADRLTHAATMYARVASGLATSGTTLQYFPELNLPYVPNNVNVDVANLYHQSFPIDGDPTGDDLRKTIRDYNGSAQEHAVWEELLNITSISTIKSLQLAGERGIPVFVINPSNASTLVPQLNLGAFTTNSILDELADGATVTVPRDPTNLQDWAGVGYITERPSGSIGFIISGGLNGQSSAIMQGGSGTGDPNDPNAPDRDPNQREAGDPINVSNGNVVRDDHDILLPAPGVPLELSRHYDSKATLNFGFGPGWVFTFADFLQITPGGPVVWQSSDGFPFTFQPDGQGGFIVPSSLRGTFTLDAQGYRFRRRDGMEHRFDLTGRLTAVRDRNGNGVDLTYDGNGLLATVVDADAPSRALTYQWTNDRITSVSDFTGRTWTYQYANGLLTRVTTPSDANAAAAVTQYEYFTDTARFGLLKTITQPDGGQISYTYYANGRGFTETDPEGFTQTFHYDLDRRETTFIDERGHRTVYAYDAAGQTVLIEYADGATERRTWVDGLVVARTDGVGNQTQFQYDAIGNVLQETDRAGQATTFTYEPNFNMVATRTEPGGRTTSFQYDVHGNWTRMTDPVGNVHTRTYDGRGLVLTETDGRGNSVAYAYNSAGQTLTITTDLPSTEQMTYDTRGNMLSKTDANGHAMTFTYDVRNRKLTETDARGGVTSYRYDVMNNLIRETDELGRSRDFAYDLRQLPVRLTFPDGTTQVSTYDGARNKTRTVDELGRVTRYDFDGRNRMSAMIRPDGTSQQMTYDKNGRLIRLRDERGFLTRYEYDVRDRYARAIDPLGGQQTWTYDAAGNMLTHTDEAGRTTHFAYDRNDNILSTTDPLGGVTTYEYDANNNIVKTTDARGNVTRYEFDVLNRRTRVIDALGGTQVTTLDAVGNRTAFADELGRTTHYTFDVLNRLTSETDPRGNTVHYTYDAVDNLVSVEDARGGLTTYTYDALDHRIRAVDPLGGIMRWTYDGVGMVASETDELGRTTMYAYDDRARLIETRTPLGDVWRMTYDGGSHVTATIDPLGHTVRQEFDELGRRSRLIDERGQSTTFTYDAVGNLLSVTDPEANQTTYVHDALNRLVSETNELNQTRTHSYDANGNRTAEVDRNGRRTEYVYDALNRPTEERWRSGATTIRTFSWTYDAVGQVTGVNDGVSQYAFQYDLVGNPTNVTNNGTPGVPRVDFTQTFDAENNRTSRVDAVAGQASATNAYVYDALQRMTRLTQSGPLVATKRVDMAYDAASQMVGLNRFADSAGATPVAQSAWTFDGYGRLVGLVHRDDAATLARYSWQYDAANRLTQQVSPDGTADYQYDAQDQLLSAAHSVLADESYAYDDNGNRISGGAVIGADNRLLSDGTYNYQYDAEGNRTQRTRISTGAVTEYEWDYRNRLTRVTERSSAAGPKTRETTFEYDAFDRRIVKSFDSDGAGAAAAEITRFVYDGDHVAYVFDGAGQRLDIFLHGPGWDRVLADEQAGGQVLWALADHLGSIRDLVNSQGTIVNHVVFDSFGRIVSQSNASIEHLFAFTGQQYDPETGLHYYRARYYDAGVGQFLSEDSVGFTDDRFHLRLYVGNNPLTNVDPTGHFIETAWDVFSFVTGVASLANNISQGNWGDAALDLIGVVADAGAILVPGCPGGASMAVKAFRGVQKLDNAINTVRAGQDAYDTASKIASGNGDKVSGWDLANLARLGMGMAGSRFKSKCFVAGTQVMVEWYEPAAAEPTAADESAATAGLFDDPTWLLAGAAAAAIVAGGEREVRRRRRRARRAAEDYRSAVDHVLADGRTLDGKVLEDDKPVDDLPIDDVPIDGIPDDDVLVDDSPLAAGDECSELPSTDTFAPRRGSTTILAAGNAPEARSATVRRTTSTGTGKVAGPRAAEPRRGWPLIAAGLALALLAWCGQPLWQANAARSPSSLIDVRPTSVHRPANDAGIAAWASKNIEDIQPGDRVLTRDPVTHELGYRRVVRVFQRTTDHLRVLGVRDASGTIQRFETTDEHPFWVADVGFVEAGRLQIGDRLESPDGDCQIVASTERHETPAGVPVFNFEVEDWHTYFVQAHGASAPPIFVHNADCGGGSKPLENMSAAERRAHFENRGVPPSQLGPSGYPKVHTVEKATLKEAKDAARNAGGSAPVKHTQDRGQPTHFHPTDQAGNKLTGKDNVHFQQRGAKPNPE